MQDNIIASHTCFGGHVESWILPVKLVYKLSYVPDDLKWATNTHDTIYTHVQGITNNIYGRPFFAPSYFLPVQPVHPYFYPSIFVFTCPYDGWKGLYIKLCMRWILTWWVFLAGKKYSHPKGKYCNLCNRCAEKMFLVSNRMS